MHSVHQHVLGAPLQVDLTQPFLQCTGGKETLMANRTVEEGTKKASRSFFHYGTIGIFQSDLSPLSSHAVVESCVMPVLLYSCENWVLTEQLISCLETFQGELAKKNLEATKVGLQHGSQCSDGLDSSESQGTGSCAEVELPPPVGVCHCMGGGVGCSSQ